MSQGHERESAELLVDIEDLRISFSGVNAGAPLVRGLNLQIRPGECVALVGESGSGKSLTARSLLGLAGDNAQVRARRLLIAGRDALRFDPGDWRQIRGRFAGLVMQDALVSLDPLRTIGQETGEVLLTHRLLADDKARGEQVLDTLTQVGIPEPGWRSNQFAHQLSGGLRQRALIAAAIAAGPRLIIADEPTTALDVSVQRQVISVLAERVAQGAGLLIISHDLNLVAQIADRVYVMHHGEVVDSGSVHQVLTQPRHPYTRQLLAASPGPDSRGTRLSSARVLPGVDDTAPLVIQRDPLPARQVTEREVLRVQGIGKSYRRRGLGRKSPAFAALQSTSFTLNSGEVLGIVGESGSGKTTCANIVLGLLAPDSGSVHLLGQRWSDVPEAQRRALRRQMQYIPQDPLSSFDPRYSVLQIIAENLPASHEHRKQATALLTQVGLNADYLDRHPRSLSGGQRQRIAIARALAAEPALIICDEPVSALDVYVQAQVLDLISELQASRGIALLFISHDLDVIRHVSDRVLVFHQGQLVEQGPVATLFDAPAHPYTRQLLSAHPGA